jgi:hypothetical protein
MPVVLLGAIATTLLVALLLAAHRRQDIHAIAHFSAERGVERTPAVVAAAIDRDPHYRGARLLVLAAVLVGNLGAAAYVLDRIALMIACLAATALLAAIGMILMAHGVRGTMAALLARESADSP